MGLTERRSSVRPIHVDAKITPPLGPATNLRPAGPHKSRRYKDRSWWKQELKKETT
jgi:hypothetical protein